MFDSVVKSSPLFITKKKRVTWVKKENGINDRRANLKQKKHTHVTK